jgi:hypothetical protein
MHKLSQIIRILFKFTFCFIHQLSDWVSASTSFGHYYSNFIPEQCWHSIRGRIKGGAISLFFLLIAGCTVADRAQLADVATTAAGVSQGLVEANPLMAPLVNHPTGLVAMAVVKLGANQALKSVEDPTVCLKGLKVTTAVGYGAALANLGIIAGAPTVFTPIAVLATYFIGKSYWENQAATECLSGYYEVIAEFPADHTPKGFGDLGTMIGTRVVAGKHLVHYLTQIPPTDALGIADAATGEVKKPANFTRIAHYVELPDGLQKGGKRPAQEEDFIFGHVYILTYRGHRWSLPI